MANKWHLKLNEEKCKIMNMTYSRQLKLILAIRTFINYQLELAVKISKSSHSREGSLSLG